MVSVSLRILSVVLNETNVGEHARSSPETISKGRYFGESLERDFILSVLPTEQPLNPLLYRTYLILWHELMLGFPKGFKIDDGPSTTVL